MYLLFACIVINALIQVQTAPSLRTKFTNVSCDYNSELASNFNCWLTQEGSLNVDMKIPRMLPFGMHTAIVVEYKIEDSVNYLTLFSYDIDTCKTLKNLAKSSLTSTWMRNVRMYGNLTNNCPMSAGNYNMRDFHLENNSIPVYLRLGSYRLSHTSYFPRANTNANTNANTVTKAKKRRLMSHIILEMKLY